MTARPACPRMTHRRQVLRVLMAAALTGALTVACRPGMAAGSGTRVFDAGAFARFRKSRAGRPFVVQLWGLSCPVCRSDLPVWAAQQRARADLDLVLIQTDAAPPEAVDEVLMARGFQSVTSWTFAQEADEHLRASIDARWHGETPLTLMVGRDGRITRHAGPLPPARLLAWLDEQGQRR